MVIDTPAQLNRKLHSGELTCSAVSLFEYLQHEELYWLLPDWCINSRGYVRSVLLYSKVPFAELQHKDILLCSESATSNNLCKILLHHQKIIPNKIELPNPQTKINDWDALVLIGDPALNFVNPEFNFVTDLAEAWVQWTEGPVVFAVQAVRKDQFEGHQPILTKILSCFSEVQNRIKNDLDAICQELQQSYPNMQTDFHDYFRCLDFQLDNACLKAIQRYSLESKQLGTLNDSPSLTFAPF